MLNTIKEFIIDLLKNSWFKMIAFILVVCIVYIVNDLSNIHLDEVYKLETQLKSGEITYEHAEFMRSALHEQIVYQLTIAIIAAMLFIASMLMEQNSKLRERVKRLDFRLWKLDRNVEEIYELQRLQYEDSDEIYEPKKQEYVENANKKHNEALKKELERLQEEHHRLIEEVQELERKHKETHEDEN